MRTQRNLYRDPVDCRANGLFKRTIDVTGSLLLLLVFLPVMAVCAAGVKLTSPGPVIFRQERVGQGKKRFFMYKFRSMYINQEQDTAWSTDSDARRTHFGAWMRKLSLDELPQLLNILKGDMSIVGPRPERQQYIDEFCQETPEFIYRLKVKAGLTGYAQIYGKYNTTPLDKLKLDLMYIESYSLLMDIRLMFLTLKIMFTKESTEGVEDGQNHA